MTLGPNPKRASRFSSLEPQSVQVDGSLGEEVLGGGWAESWALR